MVNQWSGDLEKRMGELSPVQQRAIRLIVTSEVEGVTLSRLLKTVYSCQWCGREIGRSSQRGVDRKRLRLLHEETCGLPEAEDAPANFQRVAWKFAANYTTYYRAWRKSPLFVECLKDARAEVTSAALLAAARQLQLGTFEASQELRRQLGDSEVGAGNRRLAAIAILDRADVSTATKVEDGLSRWLRELREVGDVEFGALDDWSEDD